MNKTRIHICGAEEDRQHALRIYNDLKRAGVVPWLDAKDLLPGQDGEAAIRKSIRESRYFMALLSSHSVSKKGRIQKELKYALDLLDEFPETEIFVIPVRLDDCKPAYEKLLRIEWIDLYLSYERGLNRILKAIGPESCELHEPKGFDHDVFISYSQVDNRTASDDQVGWVSYFFRCLKIRLHQMIGEDARIFCDFEMQNDSAGLEAAVKAALLVPIISPSFRNTDRCLGEIDIFIRSARQGAGVMVNDHSRIFKAVKTHVPVGKEPSEIAGFPRYEFFRTDPETGRHVEYILGFGYKIDPEFYLKLDDLAHDMIAPLEIMKSETFGDHPAQKNGVCVYLAETSSDVETVRDGIRRELSDRGCVVLPEKSASLFDENPREKIMEMLGRSDFSIHIVGEKYGAVPESSDVSTVELQMAAACEHGSRTPDFFSLVWIPKDTEPEDPRQKKFVRTIWDAPARNPRDDILQTSVDELKSVILDRLEKPDETPCEKPLTYVYLICDRDDLENTAAIKKILFESGFEILTPLFEGGETDIAEDHRENLCVCDAVLIYHGNACEKWLRGKLRDLRKARGFGRTGPMISAIYVAGPQTESKIGFETRQADFLIKNFGEFSPGDIKEFADRIKRRKEKSDA